jgi:hypothetical protein
MLNKCWVHECQGLPQGDSVFCEKHEPDSLSCSRKIVVQRQKYEIEPPLPAAEKRE